jgi:hypothetical protein
MITATVKVPMPIPHRDDAEVMETAARLLRNTRQLNGPLGRGLASLDHTREVAKNLALSYVLLNNQGGFELALRYARVEEVFAAAAYRLSMAESAVTYRSLTRKAAD